MVITVEHNERGSHLTCSHNFSNSLLLIRHLNTDWPRSVAWAGSDDLPRLNMLGVSTSVGPGWLRNADCRSSILLTQF
jgi:hypothetical protein